MDTPLQIAGYEFLQIIGEGGMATVWKARQVKLDRIVAIKVLRSRIISDRKSHERFLYEARAAASMIHPNIVHVIDAGEQDGRGYYVMEYVPGDSVGQQLVKTGAFLEPEALRIAIEVAGALEYGWTDHKTIHCDIKPDNLLQHRNGRIKVADLGLAQVLGLDIVPIDEDMTLGTPNYFAPEQALVEDGLDCRADMYALGASLYHMGTGQLPFEGLDPDVVAEKQVHGHLQDPIDLNPKLSLGFCYLLEKLMAKNPRDRHRDWSEVIQDLRRVSEGKMILHPLAEAGISTVLHSEQRPAVRSPGTGTPWLIGKKGPQTRAIGRSSATSHRSQSTVLLQQMSIRSQASMIWLYALLLVSVAAVLYGVTLLSLNH